MGVNDRLANIETEMRFPLRPHWHRIEVNRKSVKINKYTKMKNQINKGNTRVEKFKQLGLGNKQKSGS